MQKTGIISLGMVLLITLTFWRDTGTVRGETTEKELWPDREQMIKNRNVKGFGILYRIPGQWNGPVYSDTPAGSYAKWYVDFRPVESAQISELSTVDLTMCNYITFFIVKHEGMLKVAMRTDAVFQKKGCITYEVIRKVDEKKGYYKFSDFQSGDRRAYTEFFFEQDSLEMRVYTNKFNKQKNLTLHSRWKAERVDMKASYPAIRHFDYPKPVMVRDFSNVFGNDHESIYFSREKDPYPSGDEPYVGSVTFNISIDKKLNTQPDHELFIMLTTRPIFENMRYRPERLNYISKMVYLPIETRKYTLTHIHPGTYYVYSYNDVNQDRRHKSGDYISSDWNHKIVVPPEENITVDTNIDTVIP